MGHDPCSSLAVVLCVVDQGFLRLWEPASMLHWHSCISPCHVWIYCTLYLLEITFFCAYLWTSRAKMLQAWVSRGVRWPLSRGFCSLSLIFLTISENDIKFRIAKIIDLHAFRRVNPNFRVGQFFIFVKNENIISTHFEQK